MDLEILNQQMLSTDFVIKTQRQILKDFSALGCAFDAQFGETVQSTQRILAQIEYQLEQIEKQSFFTLQQLMYQIDLPENLYVGALNAEDSNKQLAEIILRREAYKIYLRSRF